MPACFQLRKKGEQEPDDLIAVDESICKHLGASCDPERWVGNWYDSIGYMLATCDHKLGSEGFKIKVKMWSHGFDGYEDRQQVLQPILKFLEENYESDSWHENKGRC